MNKQILQQLDTLFKDNCKILDAIDEGKNINIQKSIKASLISNNRLIQIFTNYIKQYDFDDEDVYTNDSSDPKVDDLKNIFGMK